MNGIQKFKYYQRKKKDFYSAANLWHYESIFGSSIRKSKPDALLSKVIISPFGSYDYLTDYKFR